jgi:hypothetical protein
MRQCRVLDIRQRPRKHLWPRSIAFQLDRCTAISKKVKVFMMNKSIRFCFFFYLETSRCVTTLSSITKKIVDGAFVYVRASFTRTINLISRIANTTICSQQVLASSIGANIWILGAFVNICSVKSSKFCYQCFILISITY